jgi:hypothetical protein
MQSDELQGHVFSTYVSLRYGLAVIGAVLPILVYVIGAFHGVELQGSMSAYYWAPGGGQAPSRDAFVGCLFAVAACLYLYKGFTTRENVALNLAAIFAVGVAVFPTEWNCQVDCGRFSVHGASAVLMFLCLVFVVWFCARDTLSLLPEPSAGRYRMLYGAIGLVMLVSPLTAFVLNSFIGAGSSYIFFIEAAGIWAFAAYWFAKSRELRKSSATRRALQGDIETSGGEAVPAPSAAAPLAPARRMAG